MASQYTHDFYAHRHEATVHSSETVLALVMDRIPSVRSAVDIGCGVGTWLSALRRRGVLDVQGYDGPWVERDLLVIPQGCFAQVELSKEIPKVTRRYDLAISLEVAEHLHASSAKEFVSFLTELSDTVLFSAAIPGQGGTGHVNEQWQSYWIDLFAGQAYGAHDCIRPSIWDDVNIPYWYRQNTLLFVKGKTNGETFPLDMVHPELYGSYAQPGVKGSFKILCGAVSSYIRRAVA